MDQTAASAGAGLIDPEFTAHPLRELAAAALERAARLGAGHADFRAERIIRQQIRLSDGHLETLFVSDDIGLAVRVVVDGTWGFAAAVDLTAEAAHGDVTWVSDYQAAPFGVSVAAKIALLAGWSSWLLADDRVDHVDASLLQVRECKFYSDGATTATQQRVRVHPELTAVAVQAGGRFETMRTLAPPAGRGYEYLTGTGWDFPGRAGRAAGPPGGQARRPGGPGRAL